ncbi:MAG: Mur ligase family protein [Candidatus Saccharimonadales bacterium]
MFKPIIFLYKPKFAKTIIYMLQSVEYQPSLYFKWFWRTNDLSKVIYRKELVPTRAAKMLLAAFRAGELIEIAASIALIIIGINNGSYPEFGYGIALLLITPVIWAHLIILPLILGDWLIVKPLNSLKIRRASKILAAHPGIKIAVAGSYGKTTMKEILLKVLSEGKKVKATPANRNVSISHAGFARSLDGDEDILIIEYGEGAPGDIARFAKKTHPNVGVITGLAPAHLDRYKTLQAAGKDIFSLRSYLKGQDLYVNGDSQLASPFIKKTDRVFSSGGISQWQVKNVKVSIEGLAFSLVNGSESITIKSRLLGRHLIAPLALAAYLGHAYGLTNQEIAKGIVAIEPFEHRMKPYQLSGAWVIDDTYNGNIEGMRAGLALLKELPAKRKIYITPGLVDQGSEEADIHRQLGKAIAGAMPDIAILMKHSVTDDIVKGMDGFKGHLLIEEDPLDFYNNLDKFVAAGDLVLMQNDWPDNYN